MKKTKTKCYLYTRVSTSMQVDGYSLDAQRDKLRKYAEYEDMVVAGEYSDEGFSGKNIQGRHEFQRMLQDIQDCKDGVEYVLVFKLSRFGRNAADVLNSLQLMQDFGVNLICVEDGIDSSKDSGKLMISVLSAVAEIERENIRTQTMAGREQKAREGKWNGGFAPYGYRLEKGELLIAEDEVDVIRTIFDRYIHTNDGVSGVAKYLNRQGFVKKLRQNGTIPGFSASFVKSIIDNPVYMGKIAYGRRRTEKKIGTRNEMHVVEQSEFPVYEGKHEAIISEEDWNLAQEKRKINAYRREKVNDPTHAHILSGILKCPCCGKSLYGNIAKAHSKDKKTRYYYYCKNTVTPTGHECTFRLNIEQMEMNRMVASIISAMVSDPRFADAIKAKIGSAVDTNDLEKQLEALQAQLRQTLGTKARLERQMDGLDVNDPYYDRKISDLQRRYDEQYGAIDEIEVQIDDVQSQIRSIRQEKISGDNIYRLLLAFDQVYEAASEVERKEFMRAFIERIELFPEKQPDGNWIRKIIFNFPVPVNGTEVKELPLENETIVDTVHLLPQFRAVFLVDMRRELSLLHSGEMCDPTEIIQNDLREITFPDVVRAAGSFSFLAVGIALEIVLQLFHGRGTMQRHWLSAICTEYQSGKDVRFIHVLCRALFVLPHLLHDLPLLLRDERLVRIFYQTLFAFRPVDPRFVFVGDGCPPQPDRVSKIHEVAENVADCCAGPRTWPERIAPMVRFPGFLEVVICRCQDILFCQNPRDLARSFPGSTEGKDLPDDLCGLCVRFQMRRVCFGRLVAVGRLAAQPFAAFRLQFLDGANLPARVLCVQLVCPVADRVKIVAALDRRIHAVVDCNEPHIFLREIDLHVVADLQILTSQPGGILYNQGGDLPGFDHFYDLLPAGTIKICS